MQALGRKILSSCYIFRAPAIGKTIKSPSIVRDAAIEASTWTNG